MFILHRGQELHTELQSFARTHDLTSAWVTGLGGSGGVTLGFYDLATKTYHWKTYDDPLEVLNLTGNLSIVDDAPFWHVHGSFSNDTYQSIGGHVQSLTVGLTLELLITPLDTPFTRSYDDETGLKLLCEV